MSLPKPSAYHLIVEHLSPTEPEAGRSPVIQQLAKVLGKTAGTPLEAANPRAEIAELMGNVTPIPWADIWLRNAGIKPQSDETCFVIEPVQMVASMNNIAMRPLPVALTEAQLEDLISVLQPVLASDSADIENINEQCLLRIRRALKVNTTPLDEARNRDLRDCLPSGDDSGWVRRTMTECQMVLHDLSAHPALAGTGVNGVWLWGNTQGASDLLKQTQNQNRLVQLRTSDPWLAALMHHSNNLRTHKKKTFPFETRMPQHNLNENTLNHASSPAYRHARRQHVHCARHHCSACSAHRHRGRAC